MIVVVTGGREFWDADRVSSALSAIHEAHGVDVLVHGGAHGADELADAWAKQAVVPCLRFPAQWSIYGASAGPVRNRLMLERAKRIAEVLRTEVRLLPFPGGRGTANCVSEAKRIGIATEAP